jgi:adenylate cyclase
MVTGQPRGRPEAAWSELTPVAPKSAWPVYLGITALLVLIVVALAGGIIWYNLRKSSELMLATADRQMVETGDMVSDRIKLLYDPLYAIVDFASEVPDIKAPINDNGHVGMPMLLRVMRFYPQILSLYVGFENGDFFMVNHIAGEDRARFRDFLGAPKNAAFSNKIVRARSDGVRVERWVFLDDDGVEVGHIDPVPTTFDPRSRPWYGPALHSDHIELSDLYIFVFNNEPGFTLSRAFHAAMPGVFGADLAAMDLSDFLAKQRITPTSLCFIFTRSGEIVSYPDQSRMPALAPHDGETMVALPKLAELNDPVVGGLFAAYQQNGASGNFVYPVADRSYIGRVVEVPARYGRNQLLGIAVPIDEIEKPAIALRNQSLFYSIAFLVLVLPLYVTLIIAWIDRRLGRSPPLSSVAEKE